MERLIITLAAATLYAIFISNGIGRELDDRIVTRPLVVAGGVVIVILGKTWGDWQEAGEWFLWFALASGPLLLRSAVIHIHNEQREKLARYSVSEDVEDAIRSRLAD